MNTYALIHGAYHGGWSWDKAVQLLEEAGHRAIAPHMASIRCAFVAGNLGGTQRFVMAL